MEKQWSLHFPLPIANIDEQSGVTQISEVLLTPGDFVEIDIEFDLVIDRKSSHGKMMLKVHLAFNHLIRKETTARNRGSCHIYDANRVLSY
jgi:hypothetical protein